MDVAPVDVDFATPMTKAPVKPPHIFFFVIDSLRRDYVAPFNPKVTFTPSFAALAQEGYAFQRRAAEVGFKEAVRERDAPYEAAP